MKTEAQLVQESLIGLGIDRPVPGYLYLKGDFLGHVETRLFSYPDKRRLGRVRWSGNINHVPFKLWGPVDFYASEPIILPAYRKESLHEDEEHE